MESVQEFVDQLNKQLEKDIRKLLQNLMLLTEKHEKNISSIDNRITGKHHAIYLHKIDSLLYEYCLNMARKSANKIYFTTSLGLPHIWNCWP